MVAEASPAQQPRWSVRAVAAPLAALAGAGAFAAALYVRDPHQQYSWGVCPLYALTGVLCPGCGGLRAINDVVNLEFTAAFFSNFLVYPIAFFAGWVWLRWLGRRVGFRIWAVPTNTWLWIVFGVVVAVWTVVRNFPGSVFAP